MAKTLRSEIPDQFGGVINEGALARYVERVERLHEERASLGEDIKAVMEEAKNAGFVPKIIRQMVRERKMEPVELQDHLALLDSYRRGLGMLAGTPLGDTAMDDQGEADRARRRVVDRLLVGLWRAPLRRPQGDRRGRGLGRAEFPDVR
jgi:uncharacterized protein (UPF0335 family)